MDRPALAQLLSDIAAGRVDCVVVHKDLGSTVTHGYLGVADGIELAVGEIAARFGIEAEEIEEEPVEAKPEKKMAPSEGREMRGGKRKSS
jgi:hypothetical protein